MDMNKSSDAISLGQGIETVLKNKKKRLDILLKQFEAANDDFIKSRSGAEKVTIQEDLEQLEVKIEKLEEEIQNLTTKSSPKTEEGAAKVRREYDYSWQGKIHRINFSQSRKIFEPILSEFENSGDRVLFFLQKSASLGGEWCIQAIKKYLDRLEFKLAPPREFTFGSYEMAEPEPFLNFLASKYNLSLRESDEDIRTYLGRINLAICNSLYAGNVFLLHVQIKCELGADDQFVHWFVEEFWHNLCLQLNPIQLIRVVGILSVDGGVPKNLINELCCTKNSFNRQKLLSLALQKWKKEEISRWLISYSGLSEPPIEMDSTKLDRMASSIYSKSNSGEPVTVYSQLMNEMSQIVG
jgi:hypothetical protein